MPFIAPKSKIFSHSAQLAVRFTASDYTLVKESIGRVASARGFSLKLEKASLFASTGLEVKTPKCTDGQRARLILISL